MDDIKTTKKRESGSLITHSFTKGGVILGILFILILLIKETPLDFTSDDTIVVGVVSPKHLPPITHSIYAAEKIMLDLFQTQIVNPTVTQPFSSVTSLLSAFESGTVHIITQFDTPSEQDNLSRYNHRVLLSSPLVCVTRTNNLSIKNPIPHESSRVLLTEQTPSIKFIVQQLNRVASANLNSILISRNTFESIRPLYPTLGVAKNCTPQLEKIHYRWSTNKTITPPVIDKLVDRLSMASRKAIELQRLAAAPIKLQFQLTPAEHRALAYNIRHRLIHYQDTIIQEASLAKLPPSLVASISYQESHWDPTAISFTGVQGFMMLTQTTARKMNVHDRMNAKQSIHGGAHYFAAILKRIPERIEGENRIALALASYNIGPTRLEAARRATQSLGLNADNWTDVKKGLRYSAHKGPVKSPYSISKSYECIHYVDSILRYQPLISWYFKNIIHFD